MKSTKLLAIFALLITSLGLSAQKVMINPFVGYTFQNKFPITGGNCILEDGITYEGTLTVPLDRSNAVEILYSRQESRLIARSYLLDEDFVEDVAMNYIMIGGKKIFPGVDENAQFYGTMKIGAAVLSSTNDNYNSITRFAAGIGAGVNLYLSETFGIHGGANLNFPITNIGAGLGWSSGGGTSVGVSGWSPIVQFSLSGGISLRLGS